HQPCTPAARQPGAEPDREHLAVCASKLSLKSDIPRLRRRGRGVQLGLEQAHRRTRPNRLNRHAKLDRHQSRTVKIGMTSLQNRLLTMNIEPSESVGVVTASIDLDHAVSVRM